MGSCQSTQGNTISVKVHPVEKNEPNRQTDGGKQAKKKEHVAISPKSHKKESPNTVNRNVVTVHHGVYDEWVWEGPAPDTPDTEEENHQDRPGFTNSLHGRSVKKHELISDDEETTEAVNEILWDCKDIVNRSPNKVILAPITRGTEDLNNEKKAKKKKKKKKKMSKNDVTKSNTNNSDVLQTDEHHQTQNKNTHCNDVNKNSAVTVTEEDEKLIIEELEYLGL